jgi:hypothetical protein
MPFFWDLWDKGFNWDGLQRFIAGYQGARVLRVDSDYLAVFS